jgi:acetoin utilization protein AcuB
VLVVFPGDPSSMVNRATTVEEVMTPDPSTIAIGATIGEAHEVMKTHHFRHLPVVEDGKLVGILTMTDIGHLGAAAPEIRAKLVGEVMTKNPFTIPPDARVEVAAGQMAVRKVHSLLVVTGGKLVGIVTTYDLLEAFARSLREEG